MARILKRHSPPKTTKEKLKLGHDSIADVELFLYAPSAKKPTRKGLVLSDIHIPFHNKDLIKQIVHEHQDADVLFLNGDIIDGYNISSFIKEKYVAFLYEYQEALKFLDDMRRIFPIVIITRGNHEYRMNKQIMARLMPDVAWRVQAECDCLGKLADGVILDDMGKEVGKLPFDNVHYEGGEQPWWTRWGKTIICHPYKGNSNYNSLTARNFAEKYFFGNFIDFDCIIAGHTHQVASVYVHGRKIIEQGCLAYPLDYAQRGTEPLPPQQLGYALIYQDSDGNANFELTRPVYLGVITASKSADLDTRIKERIKDRKKDLEEKLEFTKRSMTRARKKA